MKIRPDRLLGRTNYCSYLEPDPAIIDASVPTYQMAAAAAAAPATPTEAGGPTMMNPQLTPYGAYPPPFFYTAPVYHPYMVHTRA